ncbi:MAG: PEP/pyruvate-binding domain-containing protein, partial [Acidobacteriota bacterium]
MTDREVLEIADAGSRLERAFGRPQDVEFCLDGDGRLFFLQARPISTVEELGPAAGRPLLWDNSNIVESYAGVTSPMTFSFIQHAYAHVYHCFCDVMGIAPDTVRANRGLFTNMLGLFRGRVYYNLDHWYRLVRLFPGYDLNRGFMESMMGVSESLDPEPAEQASWAERLRSAPSLVRLLVRGGGHFAFLPKTVARFEAHFETCYRRWDAVDMDALKPHELRSLFCEMEEKLLWRWHAPIINDFYVMVAYGLLKKLCREWCGDDRGTLQNDLLAGEGGLLSTKPTRKLLEIARGVQGNPELTRFLCETTPSDAVAAVWPADGEPGDPALVGLRAALESYLGSYGFRGLDELKLEEPSLEQRPEFLFQMLANYLRRGEPIDPRASLERERRVRLDAERRAEAQLGPVRRRLFRRVLRAARRGVKNRENLRFARSKVYALVRRLLQAQGRHLATEGLLDAAEDVFYLTLDELWSFLDGTAVTTNLRALVALRRRQFDAWRAMDAPDDRFTTFGLPYHRNLLRGRPAATATAAGDDELRGVGCCPGRVRGEVRVVHSPGDASLDGEVLVAERTDPGWIPLYPTVSGLLIERGSILSHSA